MWVDFGGHRFWVQIRNIHNDPGTLQGHCVILKILRVERETSTNCNAKKEENKVRFDIFYRTVTLNTILEFTKNSAPLWVSGQDAYLVFRRSRDRAQLATQWLFIRRLWKPLTVPTFITWKRINKA